MNEEIKRFSLYDFLANLLAIFFVVGVPLIIILSLTVPSVFNFLPESWRPTVYQGTITQDYIDKYEELGVKFYSGRNNSVPHSILIEAYSINYTDENGNVIKEGQQYERLTEKYRRGGKSRTRTIKEYPTLERVFWEIDNMTDLGTDYYEPYLEDMSKLKNDARHMDLQRVEFRK